jgi:tetratricopeptide (TPR) repeat protein
VDTYTAVSLELESATTRYWLAQVHAAEKRRQPAANLLEECVQLRRRHKAILGEMEALLQQAVLAQQVKDWQTALLYLEKMLAIAISLNHLPFLLKAYVYNARVQYYLNRYWKSFISARRALALGLQLKEDEWLAHTYFIMAELKDKQADQNAALSYHLKAASLYPSNDPNPEWIEPLLGSGDYLLSKSENAADWEQALRCYTAASDIIEANQELEYLAPALGKMGRAFLKVKGLNGLDQAARCYRIELMLAGDLESVVLPVAQAVQLRVEALTGIQRCAALRKNSTGELVAG